MTFVIYLLQSDWQFDMKTWWGLRKNPTASTISPHLPATDNCEKEPCLGSSQQKSCQFVYVIQRMQTMPSISHWNIPVRISCAFKNKLKIKTSGGCPLRKAHVWATLMLLIPVITVFIEFISSSINNFPKKNHNNKLDSLF